MTVPPGGSLSPARGLSRRPAVPQPEPAAPAVPEGPAPAGPEGYWLTDTAFSGRLREAALVVLDVVEGMLNDGYTLTQALDGSHQFVADLLHLPAAYGILAEAEAAALIVEAAGQRPDRPFGPAIATALVALDQLPAETQQTLVRAAMRKATLATPRRAPSPPAPASPAPSLARRTR
ncbi:hypothetical protein ACFH04_13425 [Streptomyces noboritoensis]|uniref:Uncharacterized protein n=1 Tax=Streptomyces noboritoensis TaxID=67337 RepID=A0ABV6TJN2_9ACTN